MRSICLIAFAALMVPAGGGRPAAAHGASGTALPDYSREDVARVCMNEYGMGNSSVIDCLAQDQKEKVTLARRWPDVDESVRKSCLLRLSDLRLTSYSHLDRCVRDPDRNAADAD